LNQHRISSVGDLDWWDETKLSESISIQAVPAQHFSGRGSFDRDATLWCGYVIKGNMRTVYFVGDTGYNDITFKEIGRRCAPIHVALVPIGAYIPQWFMSPIHCAPHEAVRIHQEVKASVSVADHFGTFPLADDGQDEPIEALGIALRESGLSDKDFLIPKEGKSMEF